MRSRRIAHEEVAEVARRRLELLSAELAEIRPTGPGIPPSTGPGDGSGEPSARSLPKDGSGEPSAHTVPEGEPATGRAAREPAPGHAPREPVAPSPGRHARRPVGRMARAAGWCQDRLPPGLQGRVRLSGAQLAVVALFVLVGAVATAWWVSRADGGSEALPPVAPVPSSLITAGAADPAGAVATTAAAPASPSASSVPGAAGASAARGSAAGGSAAGASPTAIVVDVAGKVRKPGIARLPAGSRVVDALHAAGGARRGVSLTALNLARVLTDGEQIVVGVRAPPGVAASAASAAAGSAAGATAGASGSPVPMVDINTAAQGELEELPGVGPVTARAILDYRAENGSFTAVDQLLEVSGIGDATLAKIAPYATL